MKKLQKEILGVASDKSSKLVLGIFTILLLTTPYFRGLFFDTDFYKFELILGVLFVVVIVIKQKQNLSRIFQSYIALAVIGIALTYLLSALFSPVGFIAYKEAYRWLIYMLVFIGMLIILTRHLNELLQHVIFIAIAWVSIYGLFAQFEIVSFQDSYLQGRIASVFQYANTFATIVAAGIIGILLYSINSKVIWGFRLAYSILLIPLSVVFIYTQSRATLVMLPIIWLVGLLFLNVRQQIQYIVSTIILIISLIPILLMYTNYLNDKNYFMIFIILFTGILYASINTLIIILINRIKGPKKTFYWRIILPIIVLVCGVVGLIMLSSPSVIQLLPEALSSRLSDINLETRSVTERGTFYKDSVKLFMDYPILGSGGNGWNGLYYSYQSLPYTSTQTHSFFMKLLVEVGLLGTIMFLAFVGIFGYSLFRWFRKYGLNNDRIISVAIYLCMALMLLLHSIVDFDMSFGYFALLWFTLMAMIYVEIREPDTELLFKQKWLVKPMMWGTVGISIVVLLFISLNAYSATINISGIHYSEALKKVNLKIALNPSNIEYRMQRLEILDIAAQNTTDSSYTEQLLQEALKVSELDKNSPVTLLHIGQYFAKYGYGKNALDVTKQAIEQAPWLLVTYEQYISFGSQLSIAMIRNGDIEGAKESLQQVDYWLNSIEDKIQHLKTIPQSLQYPEFKLTDPILRNGGIALVVLNEYDRARVYLEPLLANNDPHKQLDAYLWLSIVEEKIGDADRSAQFLEEGRQLDTEIDQKRVELITLLDLVS